MARHLMRSILPALAGLLWSATAYAQIWDATADFTNAANPNGSWSYGYSARHDFDFVAFPNSFGSPGGFSGWYDPSINIFSTPIIQKNGSNQIQFGIAPGQLSLHPGVHANEFCVLRFTAPIAGVYDVTGQYFTGDFGNTDAYLLRDGLHNNNTGAILFSTPSTTGGGTFTLDNLNLKANETLDLAIGTGGDGAGGDSTPINLHITAIPTAVPEPGTLGMLTGTAFFGTGLLLRRRRIH